MAAVVAILVGVVGYRVYTARKKAHQAFLDVTDDLPTSQQLEEASKLIISDENGVKISLYSLFEQQRTLVIWIRNFYCGSCQAFVEAVSEAVKPNDLKLAGVKIVFIGCGDFQLIKPYREHTSCPFPIYADPTTATYKALGMTLRKLDRGKDAEVASYARTGKFGDLKKGISNAFSLKHFGKQGDSKQLGGDFILGPGLNAELAHRMRNVRDHTDVSELLAYLGLEKFGYAESTFS
ncbi:hypothetical protein BT69DRAFT_1345503 [Atractiella rhizophila]|nr:hypothetical protein BT69DRAFT_1345503 [Atractiella rhizophila]